MSVWHALVLLALLGGVALVVALIAAAIVSAQRKRR